MWELHFSERDEVSDGCREIEANTTWPALPATRLGAVSVRGLCPEPPSAIPKFNTPSSVRGALTALA